MKMTLAKTAMILAILMAATVAQADDATIKKELLSYWKDGRHVFLYKDDGIAYVMGGTSNRRWDVPNAMYYEGSVDESNPLANKIIALTKTRFITQNSNGTSTMKRVTKAEAEVYGKPGVID
jgi:hypothetical protein